ncbi:MAG: multidrug DMT transporter permease [Rhizobiales bacterium 62-47]|nr:EamA family transporter [Hyphomicrobiales bacterium]OJY10006.1 MAG: multidrug DMT transporter permease [Rhizobiales bacterium 62-47]
MSPHSSDSRFAGFLLLAVTIIGWGLNWPAVKLLLLEWPPLFSRGVAGVAAAVLLAAIALSRGESLRVPRKHWLRLAFAAFTNVFAWMGFGTVAMKYLPISEAALLAYTMPIWTMLFAWPVLGERPTLRSLVALVLAFSGLAVLFSGQGFSFDQSKLMGVAMALGAAVLFAFGSVTARTPIPLKPIALVAWQVGLGCLPMIVLGLMIEHPDLDALSPRGWALMAYMTLGPMAIAYLTWFAALSRLRPAAATTGSLGVPIVGVCAGALFLGDPFGLREIAALVLTLAGVALALRRSAAPPSIE